MKISAVLIVRNEEAHLPRCLRSIEGVVDEVVIVDTGSTDNTVEIAKTFTPDVFFTPWQDDFSAARNAALSHATCDYVLSIDADEALLDPESARAHLDSFASRHGRECIGTVTVRSPFKLGPEASENIEDISRFFGRGAYKYEGAIHEQIVPLTGTAKIAKTGLQFYHWGYRLEGGEGRAKIERNKRLLLQELDREPEDAYLLFQLGRTHFAVAEFQESIPFFERALEALGADGGPPDSPLSDAVQLTLVVSLAYSYVNTGRVDQAREFLKKCLDSGGAWIPFADFHHALGYVYLTCGDISAARQAYEESLRLGKASESVLGTGSYSSHYHLGLLRETERDLAGALEAYGSALECKSDYRPAVSRCVDFIIEYDQTIPPRIWEVGDHEMLTEVFFERIVKSFDDQQPEHGRKLVEAAGHLSRELVLELQGRLREVLESP